VCPHLFSSLVEPSEFHSVDPATISHVNDDPDWVNTSIPVPTHVNDDPDWVNTSIPVPTPVFQTSPPIADHNSVDNQLAKAL